jgi:hypothetical protein
MELYDITNYLLIILDYTWMLLLALYNFILEYKILVLANMIFITFWLYYRKFSSYYKNKTNLENKKKFNSLFNNNVITQDIISEKKYQLKYKNKKVSNRRFAKYKMNRAKLNVKKKLLYKLNNVPVNISIINYKLSEIPPNIINFVSRDNYKLNDNKLLALGAYLIAKGLFIKIFRTESNASNIITNFNSFAQLYKNYIQLNPSNTVGYNFCLKLYNQYNTVQKKYLYNIYENAEYLYLSNETIIKIKNIKPFSYIERRLEINNLFIMKKDNNVVLSYGSFIIIDINPELINDFFYNSSDYQQIKKYYKYNKMKIMYWTSVIT